MGSERKGELAVVHQGEPVGSYDLGFAVGYATARVQVRSEVDFENWHRYHPTTPKDLEQISDTGAILGPPGGKGDQPRPMRGRKRLGRSKR